MLSRLNGWQRLWVLCSGIYLLLVVLFVVIELKSETVRVTSHIVELKLLIEEATERKDQKTIVAANKKIEALQDAAIYDRLGYVTKYSLVWLISVALVYLFGITFAWVINGFKKANGS